MSEPFLGQISCFGFNFPPQNWMQCQGQLLPISQFSALFALLGTQFGGNGTTNFALPNLQANVPVGYTPSGSPPGLTPYTMGETAGTTQVTLTQATVPSHTHTMYADSTAAVAAIPAAGQTLAHGADGGGGTAVSLFAPSTAGTPATLSPSALSTYAGGAPHDNTQPTLAVNWCISTAGIFPSRQ